MKWKVMQPQGMSRGVYDAMHGYWTKCYRIPYVDGTVCVHADAFEWSVAQPVFSSKACDYLSLTHTQLLQAPSACF